MADTKKAVTSPKVNTAHVKETQFNNTTVQGGLPVTKELLSDESSQVLNVVNQVKIIFNYLDLVATCNRQGDKETDYFFLNSGLGDVLDNIEDIRESLAKISDDLCPDE